MLARDGNGVPSPSYSRFVLVTHKVTYRKNLLDD
jgi:hypothetical protein